MIPRPRPERFRLRRTMMFMNAQKPGLIKDAYIYGCDSIMLDLEDAVAENQKDAARFSLYHALKTIDYGDTEVIVRINGLETPHWQEDIRVCVAGGADGISLINTLMGMRIDLRRRAPLIKNRTGGLSGPAIFPVALRMVYDVYSAVKLPIIGMGGIASAEDVIEMMMAGATAVEIGALNLTEPFICRDIIEALPSVMEKYGITSLKEIIGAAH